MTKGKNKKMCYNISRGEKMTKGKNKILCYNISRGEKMTNQENKKICYNKDRGGETMSSQGYKKDIALKDNNQISGGKVRMRKLSRNMRIDLRFGILESLDENLRCRKDIGLMIYILIHNLKIVGRDDYGYRIYEWDIENLEAECDEFWDSNLERSPFEKIIYNLNKIKHEKDDLDKFGIEIGKLFNEELGPDLGGN